MRALRQLVTPLGAALLCNGSLSQVGVPALVAGLPAAGCSPDFFSRQFSSSSSDVEASPTSQHTLGSVTPVTRRLWHKRYTWTPEKLASAPPRDYASQLPKPPRPTVVMYPFSSDELLVEHYRNPWGEVRLGRVLEDLDSLAAYVAFEHGDVSDESSRPPLLVTASVEAIELRSSRLDLRQDMRMSGRVVWTGTSSMDILLELQQGGRQQLSALFTFVARDPVTNQPHPISPLIPRSKQDQDLFCERQRASLRRRAASAAAAAGGGPGAGAGRLPHVSLKAEQWAEELLAAAKIKHDLPALAYPNTLLMDDTSQENIFTCQPQQRNMHGRVFGGFLMRRAFELAHSTSYLFAGCRPHAVEVASITFRRPVNIGDLIRFKSWVTRTSVAPNNPAQGLAHVQVEASVTQPEKRQSTLTNTFFFLFSFDLAQDAEGNYIPPKQVLPSTEKQALQVAQLFMREA